MVTTLLLVLSGCSSVVLWNDDRGRSHYRLGFVKIIVAETDNRISAYKIQSLGLVASDGFAIGWHDDEKVLIPLKNINDSEQPYEATCGLVVVLRTKAELEHAHQLIKGLEGENVCVASF